MCGKHVSMAMAMLILACGCSDDSTDLAGDRSNGGARDGGSQADGPRSTSSSGGWRDPTPEVEEPLDPEEQFNAQVEYLFRDLESEDEAVREQASKSLVELGERVVPQLCNRLGDDKLGKPVREALIQIGAAALPQLADAIDDPYDYKQNNAATAILNIDNSITTPEALKATAWTLEEHLRRNPNHYHYGVDVLFSSALKNVQNPAVFPVLLTGLQDDRMFRPENFSLAEYVTGAMLRLGPEAARPHLEQLVEINDRIKDRDDVHEKTRAAVAKLVETATQ